MLRQVPYIALFVLAVEATAWSHVDMDLRHEFGNVLVPRQTTNLQVRFFTNISIPDEGQPTVQQKLTPKHRPSLRHWEALLPNR